jgi:hypothetical protein
MMSYPNDPVDYQKIGNDWHAERMYIRFFCNCCGEYFYTDQTEDAQYMVKKGPFSFSDPSRFECMDCYRECFLGQACQKQNE